MPRRTRWLDDYAVLSPPAGGQSESEIDTQLSGELHTQGITVVRLILRVTGTPTTLGASANFTFGVVMVNLDAIAAGAFPDPAGVDEVPWMVRDRLFMIRDADAGPQSVMASYDIRSMRKYNGSLDLQG